MTGRSGGSIVAVRGHLVEVDLPLARVGYGVRISGDGCAVAGRITSVRDARAFVAPFGALDGIAIGARVATDPRALAIPLGTPLLGRAIDGAGLPLDGAPAPRGRLVSAVAVPPAVGERLPCCVPLWTGVRALDGPLTFGRGARIGVFGSPGAGKSTLLDAVVHGAQVDAVVVALVGERGREAERWIAALNARATIVCATADRTPGERVRAAEVAFAQAAALRARGLDVLLVVDSLARVCGAAREIALAAGEPVGRGGYPASVFALLGRLVEGAGALRSGSVTLVATVLSGGPDEHDPVAEAARAALDGHVVLSQRLARAGHFPAIDLVRSASRTLADVVSPEHRHAAGVMRAAIAALDESREARALGLVPTDAFLVRCLAQERGLERFLRQGPRPSSAHETLTELLRLADTLDDGRLR
ncbi:MAG: EscN/YscN/HrcN family type III secretion system ATPase [Candidatus Eremiobacteraeota bacterium]|nr:EscN/YscN/HrcN family type III secretion system ATPase [Candidatus Eremiobacteraeota bacterium]MBV9408998.1 EscN/YscN/HrcN family type III secretion system ATPase [Candidatus Eremiobacteraeota bacterium]